MSTIDNQSIFENVITAIEHFARDATDLQTARTAFQVLTRMTATWGGPDIAALATSSPPPNSPTNLAPTPVIPGFDTFAITHFSPLSWAIPSADDFKVRDPTSRLFVQEIAVLQQEILKKTGEVYINALRSELGGMGVAGSEVEIYLQRLRGDTKGFKEFLVGFLGRGES
jgi:exportin-T